jgi:hypothetical protein
MVIWLVQLWVAITMGSFESAWAAVAPSTIELTAAAVASLFKNLIHISEKYCYPQWIITYFL